MRLVVIGGMGAGLSAASRARRLDKSLDIVVLEKSGVISFAACGLPYYIEGKVTSEADLTVYTPDHFRRERNIQVRTGTTVEQIHHSRRQLVLSDGEQLPYDRLVIATGARPNLAFLESALPPNAFTLNCLEDGQRLKRFLEASRPRQAVVVGASYIGLEAADALRARGLAVTVLEASSYVLGRPEPELTATVCDQLRRSGIEVRLGVPVRRIEPDRVNDAACDIVVVAAGLVPNVELAAEAGVRLGATGAIAVTERMETSIGGVFAAGDCAETLHIVTGRPAYIPLGTTANRMGRIAGACAAGARERFTGVAGTSIVKICGLGVAVTGLSLAEAAKEGFDAVASRVKGLDRPKYFQGQTTIVELVADRRTRRLLGGSVTGLEGVAGRINVIAAAITSRLRVEEFEQLDLAYSPPLAPAWDPVLVAAHELLKLLD